MSEATPLKIGFIGLGTMGAPMAGHLATAGHQTLIWNRTPGKDSLPISKGASPASLEEIAQSCPIICLCLGRTEDVRQIVEKLLKSTKTGALIIDHSTIAPAGALEIAQLCRSHSAEFLDAPITGGSAGAINGTLTIFCGGSPESFAQAEPILQAYGRRVAHVGSSGKGQLMKMANQIAVGGALIGLCESLAFAKKAGLDLATTRELLNTGSAGSWAFENYGPKILENDHTPGFSVKNQRKDFGYCMNSADELGLKIPLTELTDSLLAHLTAAGREEEATSALFDVLVGEVNS